MEQPGDITSRPAIADSAGTYTHRDLENAAARVARRLLGGAPDLDEARVALLVEPDLHFAAALRGIYRAGGIAVPLALSHPPAELEHVLRDSGARTAVVSRALRSRLEPLAAELGFEVFEAETLIAAGDPLRPLPEVTPGRRALIVYTSGTTGRPKGAVWTHAGLTWQCDTLIRAWGWVPDDRALLVLPLHHVHGLVNVLSCALAAGATCEMLPRFDPATVWERLASGEVTVFMAVPTIYHRLLTAWDEASPRDQERWSKGSAGLRLMVSGSAALPTQTFERWRALTGHALLERYGMTEIGMALSNPLVGERIPGTVGRPLPGVETRFAEEAGTSMGELWVRSPGIFLEYWRRPEATADSFHDDWFVTGDTAILADGVFRILGRSSVDILKTGGYKVSALEIEGVLRDHPAAVECAVVGIPDPEWGERIAAAVVLKPGTSLDLEALRTFARDHLAPYKLPTRLALVPDLPKNAMGKVVKAEVKQLFPG